MAFIVADRVRETSTSTGTGAFSLAGAVIGYQAFSSAIGNGNTTYYTISNPGVNEWEVGIGTVAAGTLTRTTVLASSAGGTTSVSFTAGTKDVFCTYPAEAAVFSGNQVTLTNKTINGPDNTLTNIGNSSLVNSSLTIGTTNIALGATSLTLAGLTSVTATTFNGALSGNATTATTATNLAGGIASQIPYQTAAGTTSFISNGTSGQVLTSNGTSAPSWGSNQITLGSTTVSLGGTASSLAGLSSISTVNATVSALTSGRVTYATTGGQLTDSANLAWNGTTLSITGAVAASQDSSFTSTGALLISKGTTAQQPGSPATGMMRYNSTTNQFEGYSGASPAWKSIGGSALSNDTATATALYPVFAGATSGTAENLYTSNAKLLYTPSTGALQASEMVASNGMLVHANTVTADYSIPANYNAIAAGPVSVASGVTVTVPSGSVWTIV
jgi:hypothetical protein